MYDLGRNVQIYVARTSVEVPNKGVGFYQRGIKIYRDGNTAKPEFNLGQGGSSEGLVGYLSSVGRYGLE